MGFRPLPDTDNVESTLIYYKANDKGSVLKWAKVIDDFLQRKFAFIFVVLAIKIPLLNNKYSMNEVTTLI